MVLDCAVRHSLLSAFVPEFGLLPSSFTDSTMKPLLSGACQRNPPADVTEDGEAES